MQSATVATRPATRARASAPPTAPARPRRTPGRRRAGVVAAALVALTAIGLVLVTTTSSSDPLLGRLLHHGAASYPGIDRTDGWLGDRSVTAFDTDEPAVSRLEPQLRGALQQATRDASRAGIDVRINSGWRSRAYQRALLHAAVVRYGSYGAARRWVNTPQDSTHVQGAAVDVGPSGADEWLARHGHEYGLCRVYVNEPWHFELLTTPGGPCPTRLEADARS